MSEFQLILLNEANRPPRQARAGDGFSLIPFPSHVKMAPILPIPKPAPTAEDIDNWLTPRQAVQLLRSVYEDRWLAEHTLLERLKGGMVQAIARNTTRSDRTDGAALVRISPEHWRYVNETSSFWTTGDLVYTYRRDIYDEVTFRHFDVRFEPEGVNAIIGSAAPDIAPTPDLPEANEPTERGPPVSEAHLQAWYEVYRQVYQGAADTEDTAVRSARGMFPGKSVSRDKIRKLRGAQKRGRKPGETAK